MKIDPKKTDKKEKAPRKDLKFLKESFGGIRKVDMNEAGFDKKLFVKFSFTY